MRAEQWEREDARVTVVIPNYNGMKYLPQCIAALKRQTERDFSLLVMENGSTDGSAEWLREEGIPTIFSEENLGFASGVNRAIREVRTPYVLLLNNDTEVFPDFVRALEESISRHERIFSVSAMMIRTQNHDEIDDAGDLVSLPGWAFQRGTMEPCAAYEKEAEVFSACGGAAIYRTDLYRALGGLDESYFAYLEDIDLGWRSSRVTGISTARRPRCITSAPRPADRNTMRLRCGSPRETIFSRWRKTSRSGSLSGTCPSFSAALP